jgi:spermidine synthase
MIKFVKGARMAAVRRGMLSHKKASSWRGLLAGALHEKLGQSFDEAYETLGDVPADVLHEFSQDFPGTTVVYSSKDVSVLQTTTSIALHHTTEEHAEATTHTTSIDTDKYTERSLVFNRNIDLKQSSVLVTETRTPAGTGTPADAHRATSLVQLDRPPEGALEGLSLVASLCDKQKEGEGEGEGAPHIQLLVLGGGGCSVPSFMYTALKPDYPGLEVDVVELNREVCAVARKYFGVAELEATSRGAFVLHRKDARVHLRDMVHRGETVDMLVVDMEDGGFSLDGAGDSDSGCGGGGGEGVVDVQAPPKWLLSEDTLTSLAAAVCPGGSIAINTLASPAGYKHVAAKLDRVFKAHNFGYSVCLPTPPADARHATMETEAETKTERQRFYVSVKLKGVRKFALDEAVVEKLVRPDTHAHWLGALRGRHWYKL